MKSCPELLGYSGTGQPSWIITPGESNVTSGTPRVVEEPPSWPPALHHPNLDRLWGVLQCGFSGDDSLFVPGKPLHIDDRNRNPKDRDCNDSEESRT